MTLYDLPPWVTDPCHDLHSRVLCWYIPSTNVVEIRVSETETIVVIANEIS